AAVAPTPQDLPNTQALGKIIYDDYFLVFQLSGLILLVAMIGAIVLTLREREGVKKQNVLAQIYRTREQSVEVRDVKPGEGI
ncbi:MAG: NADH-quinone oxidoreductase subunit J, partial [Pseudomonadota bacterium]